LEIVAAAVSKAAAEAAAALDRSSDTRWLIALIAAVAA
jgi:hypothetical protein